MSLQIKGVHFVEKESILNIYMPQKVSLYQIIHSQGSLKPLEKLLIAKKIAKALYKISAIGNHILPGQTFSHSHLTSRNIFVNLADM